MSRKIAKACASGGSYAPSPPESYAHGSCIFSKIVKSLLLLFSWHESRQLLSCTILDSSVRQIFHCWNDILVRLLPMQRSAYEILRQNARISAVAKHYYQGLQRLVRLLLLLLLLLRARTCDGMLWCCRAVASSANEMRWLLMMLSIGLTASL